MSSIQIRKILCPVDFSEPSHKAVEYAKALREKFGAELLLLHVIEPFLTQSFIAFDPNLGTQVVEEVEEKARELLENLRQASPDIQTMIRKGKPYEEIVEVAKTEKVDLIVMGTHGLKGISHFLIGSVAEKVVRHAPCPVLTVKPKEE